MTITPCYKLNSFLRKYLQFFYNSDNIFMLVYVHVVTKLYYLMLLLPLSIIVLLFEIIMTVEISYNVGLIEYSFI